MKKQMPREEDLRKRIEEKEVKTGRHRKQISESGKSRDTGGRRMSCHALTKEPSQDSSADNVLPLCHDSKPFVEHLLPLRNELRIKGTNKRAGRKRGQTDKGLRERFMKGQNLAKTQRTA